MPDIHSPVRINRTHRFVAVGGVFEEVEQTLGQAGNYNNSSVSIYVSNSLPRMDVLWKFSSTREGVTLLGRTTV